VQPELAMPPDSLTGISPLDLLNFSADIIVVVDDDARLEFVSAAVRPLLGRDAHEWIGRSIIDFIHPDDLTHATARMEAVLDGMASSPQIVRIPDVNGQWVPVEVVGRRVVTKSGHRKLVISVRDTTDRQKLLERVQWQAAHDELTGLLSLSGLQDRCGADETLLTSGCMLVMRLDVDGFQRINEFYGHHFGDETMRLFGRRFVEMAQTDAFAARLGGDDFVIVQPCPDAAPSTPMESLLRREAERFVERLGAQYEHDGIEIALSFRVGLARVSGPHELLVGIAEADSALAYAKRRDLDLCVFDAGMREATAKRRSLESALRDELRDGANIELHYQPIVDARSRQVVSYEGLARWSTRDHVVVSPSEFIPIAEATGLMAPLTKHVLQVGIAQLAAWSSSSQTVATTIAVNVPVAQVQREDFADYVETLLTRYGVAPERLAIEITESNMIERLDLVRHSLDRLRALGCSTAIDDFGTGYSSFGWLRDLPVQIIKIDRSFITSIATDITAVHIVRAMVDLCKRLGFIVIAEGVETQTQADMLTALGVDRLQGYAFGVAGPADEAGPLFAQHIRVRP
jgi:PAS domain S-box-containing protein/diguanylate cyclase (GGDEF)-like protein